MILHNCKFDSDVQTREMRVERSETILTLEIENGIVNVLECQEGQGEIVS